MADLADTAARRWSETDAGMWEMRGQRRNHLSSKVLCWTALDRAGKLAPQLGDYAKTEQWEAAREDIRAAILDRGWSEDKRGDRPRAERGRTCAALSQRRGNQRRRAQRRRAPS